MRDRGAPGSLMYFPFYQSLIFLNFVIAILTMTILRFMENQEIYNLYYFQRFLPSFKYLTQF